LDDFLPVRNPLLIVLSGPSGVGKDSVIRELKRSFEEVHYAVTATTRPRRQGEIAGSSYFFVTEGEYRSLLDRGELLAPARVHGYWYGAPLAPLRSALRDGQDVLLKLDVQGAIQVRRCLPQATFIFLAPSSMAELLQRLRCRSTESSEDLEQRMKDARFEMEQMPCYDYVVVNGEDDLPATVASVSCIIAAERLRVHRQRLTL